MTGTLTGTAIFAGTTLVATGQRDLFVAAASPSGDWMGAVRVGSDGGVTEGSTIRLTPGGGALVGGDFSRTTSFGALPPVTAQPSRQGFVGALGPDLAWRWVTPFGRPGGGGVNDLVPAGQGRILVAGIISGQTAAMAPVPLPWPGSGGRIAVGLLMPGSSLSSVYKQAVGGW